MPERRFRLWVDIAAVLRTEIQAGVWRDGDRLPPIRELAERFGAQPSTVGKALQQLVSEGYLTQPHGLREWRVRLDRPKSRRVGSFWEDPAWELPRVQTVFARVEEAPESIRRKFGGEPRLLHWLSHQYDGDELVAISDAWYMPSSWLLEFAHRPRRGIDFYARIAEERGLELAGWQETVEARVATPEERRVFTSTGRAALVVLKIEREARAVTGETLELCYLTDRASRYVLSYWVPHQPS